MSIELWCTQDLGVSRYSTLREQDIYLMSIIHVRWSPGQFACRRMLREFANTSYHSND